MSAATTITVPGKLYLAGEYAVVYGKHAILVPVNKTMTITVQDSTHYHIEAQESITFTHDLKALTHRPLLHEIFKTIMNHTSIKPVAITVTSDLDDENGRSLGLGSSAAFTTGLIEALLKHNDTDHDPLTVYKLAVKTQENLNMHSSFGDLALTAFKRPILYKRFTCTKALDQPWPGLIIEPLTINMPPLTIINTGVKSSSSAHVNAVNLVSDTPCFQRFLSQSDTLVNKIIEAKTLTLSMVNDLHENLKILETCANITLFTHDMARIKQRTASQSVASKFSGAGGGDNLLLFSENHGIKDHIDALLTAASYDPHSILIRT